MGLFNKQKNYAKLEEFIIKHDAGELDWNHLNDYMISNRIDEETYNKVRRESHKKYADMGIVEHQNWYALLVAGINKEESFKYYNLAAEQGNVYAMKQLAFAYSEASEGTDISFRVDPEREIFWRRKAAETGDPEALCDYAREFTIGEIVPKNEDKAEQLYFESAKKGYLEACIGLALLPKNMNNSERKIDIFTYVLRSNNVDENVFRKAVRLLGMEYFPKEDNEMANPRLCAYCFSLAYILGEDWLADSIRNIGYVAGDEWEKWVDDARNLRFDP